MCGINGILRLEVDAPPVSLEELRRTRDAMAARGPDGVGEWISPDGRIGLGHRRLAVIDLSDAGLQPMASPDGRYHVSFNGEIYNYAEIRRELERQGVAFRSDSDTEVLLALYIRDGDEFLGRLRGMFALSIWDAKRRRLLLARDPYGIKPLYYANTGGVLRFASQVKALVAGGAIPDELDEGGLVGFLSWGSVPEPTTLNRHIRAVPAGHRVVVEGGEVAPPRAHYRFEADLGGDQPDLDAVVRAFEDTSRAHLVADVPVAVFLSAGLDSSLIAALATRHSDVQLTTLTLRFDEFAGTPQDEAPLAAEIARGLGTRHLEQRVSRDDFLDLWPRVTRAMDQPSIDGFNTYVVSHAARAAGFKVVLSGLGGDELMGSYATFRDVPRWSRWASRLRGVPGLPALWPMLARFRSMQPKLAGFLRHGRDLAGAYFLRHGLFLPAELPRVIDPDLARAGLERYDPVEDIAGTLRTLPASEDTERRDWTAVHLMCSRQFMGNQLLRDSDWASMAHSLELRVPLVDARLRSAMNAAGFEPARTEGKAALVRRAAPELPEALWNRPKSGFSIPVMAWLDPGDGRESTAGRDSRRLALRVLGEFGVEGRRDVRVA